MPTKEASHQLPLGIGGSSSTNLVATTKRANRRIGRKAASLQPALAISDRVFLPVLDVPKTRADCPVDHENCGAVRCFWNLARVDAENRAGRPGLSAVPRDARGFTQAIQGQAGTDRPGTTLRPVWLSVRGLEIAREIKVYVAHNADDGIELFEVRFGTLDYWLENLRIGEPVLVFDEESGEKLGRGRLRAKDEFVFDSPLPDRVFNSSSAIVLTRVRGVPRCGAAMIEQHGKMSNEQIGDAIGRHRTLVAREIKQAIKKAVKEGERMGIEREDLMGALMTMGDEE